VNVVSVVSVENLINYENNKQPLFSSICERSVDVTKNILYPARTTLIWMIAQYVHYPGLKSHVGFNMYIVQGSNPIWVSICTLSRAQIPSGFQDR